MDIASNYNAGIGIVRPPLVGQALCFTDKLSFCLFYQSTALSSRAVDALQIYFGG